MAFSRPRLMGDLTFELFGRTLVLTVDHPEIHAYCRSAYKALLASAAAPQCDRAEIAFAPPRARLNGADVELKEKAFRSPFHMAVYASSAIFQRWFLLHGAYSPWYAAGLCIDGKAVVLSAPTGTGKTTITLEMLRRGYGFYGDEFVFIRKRDRLVLPFARSLLVREGTRKLLAHDARLQHALDRSQFHDGERCRAWHFVHAQDVYGAPALAPPAPLHYAVVLERGDATALHPLPPSVFALHVALRVGHEDTGLDRLTSLVRLLDGVACYRLTVQDPAVAADALCALSSVAA